VVGFDFADGDSYTGTQGEIPDTAKEPPTDYRASSRPYQGAENTRHVSRNGCNIYRLTSFGRRYAF
jgi:hypothetical protein